jgi:hypothetical protein
MAPYHVVLVHFPIALWMTATLAILFRALSDGPLARSIDRALVPLLTLGLIMGLAAYVVGLMVWPWEALSSTPMGRNYMLLASWTVGYWALILFILWSKGDAIWQGPNRTSWPELRSSARASSPSRERSVATLLASTANSSTCCASSAGRSTPHSIFRPGR